MYKKRSDKENLKDKSQNSHASNNNLANKSDFKFLEAFIDHIKSIEDLKQKYNISYDQILDIITRQLKPSETTIPISVFNTYALSCLEIVVKYLKENLSLGFSDIARILSRDPRTVWVTYRNSKLKNPAPLEVASSKFYVPVHIFSDRRFSALEALVFYLYKSLSLKIVQISVLLKKDHSTIWTTLSRAKKKVVGQNE